MENRTAVKGYRDLEVWQKGIVLVEECYRLTRDFLKSEIYGLSSQLQRAAVSIPSNIAEGRGRKNTKEFIHYLAIAFGSLAELETHIIIAQKLGYANSERADALLSQTETIGKMIHALQAALDRRMKSPNP